MGENRRVVLSIPIDLHLRLEAMAAIDRTSLSEMVCNVLQTVTLTPDDAPPREPSRSAIGSTQSRTSINPAELSDAELDLLLGQQKQRMEHWRKICATAHPDPIKQQMCDADAKLFEKLDWEMTKRRMLYGYRQRAKRDCAGDVGEFLTL